MTTTTSKIPYIIPPKVEFAVVGNADAGTGTIEIRKFGELTKNELDYIDLNSQGIPDSQEIAIATAAEIAEKMGSSILDTANNLLTDNYDFFKNNLDIITNFNKEIRASSRKRKPIIASAIIKFRLNEDWELQDADNPEQITPALLNAIADFAIKERDGWVDETPEEDPTAEAQEAPATTFDDEETEEVEAPATLDA